MVVIRAAITSLLVLASACTVGEVPPSGSTPTPDAAGPTHTPDAAGSGNNTPTPDETFAANVSPQVTNCLGCHNGSQKPNLRSATLLESQYKLKPGATNVLVTHGAHTGPALTDTQKTAVVSWINSL